MVLPKGQKSAQVENRALKTKTLVAVAKANLEQLQAKLKTAQVRIVELEADNKHLKERIIELEKKPFKILGWSLVQRKAGGGKHQYWYAGKSFDGKMQWIYLGKELDLKAARVRIEKYLGKREKGRKVRARR